MIQITWTDGKGLSGVREFKNVDEAAEFLQTLQREAQEEEEAKVDCIHEPKAKMCGGCQ